MGFRSACEESIEVLVAERILRPLGSEPVVRRLVDPPGTDNAAGSELVDDEGDEANLVGGVALAVEEVDESGPWQRRGRDQRSSR